jgi:hypothetical protein
MRKTGFALALAAMLVVPSTGMSAPTKEDTKAASKECHDLRAASGTKENFRTLYGPFGDCVSTKAKEEAAERRAARRAAREACQADESIEGKSFAECVRSESAEIKAKKDAKDQARVEAAETCATEQEDEAAFAEKYGTGKNAFRRCVHQNT